MSVNPLHRLQKRQEAAVILLALGHIATLLTIYHEWRSPIGYATHYLFCDTAVSRKVVQQNCTRQCRKVVWEMRESMRGASVRMHIVME